MIPWGAGRLGHDYALGPPCTGQARPARKMEVMTGVRSRVRARPSTPPTERVSPRRANSRTNCGRTTVRLEISQRSLIDAWK